MLPFGAIKHADLVYYLRKAGYTGPRPGGRHGFMLKGSARLILPNPHRGDIGGALLARLLRQARISREDWEAL